MSYMQQLADGRVVPQTSLPESMWNPKTGNPDSETERPETGTEKPDSGTGQDDSGTKQTEDETHEETPVAKQRDWVDEAYKCFIKDAGDIDPTDPVKAVEAYFQKNATDELKARCKAEGKDAKGCWKFIKAVARKALHGSSGHIDPGVVYAIAMHWFEDVPKDWDAASAKDPARQAPKKPKAEKKAKPKKPAETPSEIKKEKERKAKAAKPRAKKPKHQQGFFFDMLETPVTTPEKESEARK